nr:unnamed protein product [Callosobruchus chinensis]
MVRMARSRSRTFLGESPPKERPKGIRICQKLGKTMSLKSLPNSRTPILTLLGLLPRITTKRISYFPSRRIVELEVNRKRA